MTADTLAAAPHMLDVGALPTLGDYGYAGGRQSFHAFCRRVFAPGGPRFLRSADGALAVFRHADVRALAAAPDMSTLAPAVMFPGLLEDPAQSAGRPGFAVADLIKNQLFTSNAPLNPALRRVLLNQVGPRPVATHADRTRAIAAELLAGLPIGEPVDFVGRFAEPLIGRYWGGLLDMPDDEAVAAAVEARRMSPMLNLAPKPEARAGIDAAARAYRGLVEGAGDRALAKGDCPFVAGIARDLAAIDIADDLGHGGFVPKSAGAFLAGNLFDGFHTAALAVANTLYVLAQRPHVLAALRRSPEKIAAAVSESLRLEPPVIQLNRLTTAEVAYDDVIIPQGVQVMVMWGVGNQDPAAFPDPERFDLDRPQQGVTTFGGGAHICPGRFVASLAARCMVETVIASGLQVSLASDEDHWLPGSVMSQLAQLPVVLTKAAAT
ncbi:cytochrome P450 [Caulobacter sp. KR2-114]|uniref:cytochrome P450 n=1 Tax=Caulobacter sp. KR2-114 TaxID=3400912 RepID=UPI003BFDDBAB